MKERLISEFYISREGHKVFGPVSVDEVKLLVDGGFLTVYDFIFVTKKMKWFLLGELKAFKHLLPTKPTNEVILEQPYIHILIDNQHAGPFTKNQVKEKIEAREIGYFDYIFVEGHRDWIQIKSVPVFRELLQRIQDRPTGDPTSGDTSTRKDLFKSSAVSHTQAQYELPPLNVEDEANKSANSSSVEIDQLLTKAAEAEEEFSPEDDALLASLPDVRAFVSAPSLDTIETSNVGGAMQALEGEQDEDRTKLSVKLGKVVHGRAMIDHEEQMDRRLPLNSQNIPDEFLTKIKDMEKEVDPNNPHLQSAEEIFTGDTFEIINQPIWILKSEKDPGKLHTFSEILNLKADNHLEGSSELKQKGTMAWKRLDEIYEFNTKVIRKIVEVDGREEEKIFLKRKDLRVSYYSPAVIEMEGMRLQGFCTSISMGGCFIELPRVDKISQSAAKIKILSGAIPVEIETNGFVRRILKQKPKGVGIQFHELAPDTEKNIEEFIRKYMSTTTKNSA